MTVRMPRAVLVGGLLIVGSCSAERTGENTGISRQALTTNERILGFESLSDWTSTTTTPALSDTRVEGAHSIAVQGGSHRLTSANLSSLGQVGAAVTIDVRQPNPTPNPDWLGAVRIAYDIPSRGIWWRDLGEKPLVLPLGQFVRITFPLTAEQQAELASSYSDLRIYVELYTTQSTPPATWLMDRLDFGQIAPGPDGGASGGSSGEGGAGGSAGSAGSGGSGAAAGTGASSGSGGSGGSGPACVAPSKPYEFYIRLPRDLRRNDVALSSHGPNPVEVHDGVAVLQLNGAAHANVSAVGCSVPLVLGPQADVGTLSVECDSMLRNESHVHGNVITTGTVNREPGSLIDGTIVSQALTPHHVESWTVCFPPRGPNVLLEPGEQRFLAPGSYELLNVKSAATLRLQAGGEPYYFAAVTIHPQANVIVEGSGPIRVYVDGDFTFRGQLSRTVDHNQTLIGSTANMYVDRPLRATLIAPDGAITLASPPPGSSVLYTGAFHGESVIVHQWATVFHEPLAPGVVCGSGSPCSAACPCPPGSGPCADDSQCQEGECENSICGPTPDHCTNGVQDGGETDVDCGGPCPGCNLGGGCDSTQDCATGLACGPNNGGCFGKARSQSVCWASVCEDGVAEHECGAPDSPCGVNCSCATPCDASDPSSVCPAGEECKAGFGPLVGSSSPDVCLNPICPSDDEELCSDDGLSLCGKCICKPDCSTATCQNPDDGCGGDCPGVCDEGETGCTEDVHCPPGWTCDPNADGTTTCRPDDCSFRVLTPPLCGSPGALCGEQCPACTPQCDGRQCGPDPNCGVSCGTCNSNSFCDAAGQCVTPIGDPPVTVPDASGGPRELDDIPSPPASAVGALEGRFSVSDQGLSQYTVPIDVPPGRAGLQPVLSLVYGGTRDNGDLGIGWRIDGLSKITRCPRIHAIDRYAAPIQNDPSDMFCLDGKRLHRVSGTHGSDGAEYRTLIDSFAKIVSRVDSGGGVQLDEWFGIPRVDRPRQGPDAFEVRTKDGLILTYGKTRDATVMGLNGVRHAWLLSRVEDRAGNTIIYSYENLGVNVPNSLLLKEPYITNMVRPRLIAYTGHGQIAGNRTVLFRYEERPDPLRHYLQGGGAAFSPDRLSRISTFVKGRPVKSYKLEYGPGAVSQISKIFECAGDDDVHCKAPTTFEYEEHAGFEFGNGGPNTVSAVQLDVDGNGIADFLNTNVNVSGGGLSPALKAVAFGTDIAISLGASRFAGPVGGMAINLGWGLIKDEFWGLFAAKPEIDFTFDVLLGTGFRGNPSIVTNVQGIPCNNVPRYLLDYDRDGRDDVLADCSSSSFDGNILISRSLGNGQFEVQQGPTLPRDEGMPRPILYDVDGDSLQDIVSCKDKHTLEVRLRRSPNQDFFPPIELKTPGEPPPFPFPDERPGLPLCGQTPAFLAPPTYTIFDVDGDGTSELFVRAEKGWLVLRLFIEGDERKLAFEPVVFQDIGHSKLGKGLMLGDFNGDGLVDVWRAEGPEGVIWVNEGGGRFARRTVFRPQPAADFDPPLSYRATAVADYDGDGRSDMVEHWSRPVGSGYIRYNVALVPNSLVQQLSPVVANDLRWTSGQGALVPGAFTKAADLDGDGNIDLFGESAVFYGSSRRTALLKRVEDGMGNFVRVLYDNSQGTVGAYTSDCADSTTFPETCLKRLKGLVAQHTEGVVDSSGLEVVEREYQYSYKNARVNTAGHGWLGFEQRRVTERSRAAESFSLETTRVITTDFEPPVRYGLTGNPAPPIPRYFYPLAGAVKSVTVEYPAPFEAGPLEGGTFVRRDRVVNDWQLKLSESGLVFPYLAGIERTVTEQGLSTQEVALTKCVTTNEADGYGNVTRRVEECQFSGGSVLERTETEAVFMPQPGPWLVSNAELVTLRRTRGGSVQLRVVDLEYDDRGFVTAIVRSPFGPPSERHRSEYQRDAFGNVERITETVPTGEAPRVTQFAYDADKVFPLTITDPAGHVAQIRVDPRWGTTKTIADANGIAVQRVYDGLGLLSEVRDGYGTTLYTYSNSATSELDTPLGIVRPRIQVSIAREGVAGTRTGSSVKLIDRLGRVVQVSEEGFGGAEVVQHSVYDPRGRLRGVTLPHLAGSTDAPTVTYAYDHLNRLISAEHSDGSFVERQYASSASLSPVFVNWLTGLSCGSVPGVLCAVDIVRSIDEEGRQNVVIRDHGGRVVRTIDGDNVVSAEFTSNFQYDGFGRLNVALDNGGLATRFNYDAYGRLLSQEDPDVGTTSYTYNGFDELKTRTDPKNQLRTYTYDTLGRLTRIDDPAGATRRIYDQGVNALGRLSETISPPTAENPAGLRVVFSYELPTDDNNRGALETLDYLIDDTVYSVTTSYDDLGRPQRVEYPDLGSGDPIVAQYEYSPSGVLASVREVGGGSPRLLWRLDSVAEGHLPLRETFGNDATTIYTYDPERRFVRGIETRLDGNVVQNLEYLYYDNGLVEREIAHHAGIVTRHDYDALNRLSQTVVVRPQSQLVFSYSYDVLGNIVNRAGTTLTYRQNQRHLIDTVGDVSYQYDANGNVSERSGIGIPGNLQTFEYTPFDLPKLITTGTGSQQKVTKFEYSANEKRLVRRDADQTRHFVPDLYQRLIDAQGNTVEEVFRLYADRRPLGEIVRKNGADETLFFHPDRQGSIVLSSTSTGATFGRDFDDFGATTFMNLPERTRAGYTGHQHDSDLGLIDMTGRVYDPFAGRFLTADRVFQAPFSTQGLNRYSYVFNDPINFVDPSGFSATETMNDIVKFFVLAGHVGSVALTAYGFSAPVPAETLRPIVSELDSNPLSSRSFESRPPPPLPDHPIPLPESGDPWENVFGQELPPLPKADPKPARRRISKPVILDEDTIRVPRIDPDEINEVVRKSIEIGKEASREEQARLDRIERRYREVPVGGNSRTYFGIGEEEWYAGKEAGKEIKKTVSTARKCLTFSWGGCIKGIVEGLSKPAYDVPPERLEPEAF